MAAAGCHAHAARVAPRAACRQGVVSLKAQETDTKRASKVPWIVVKDTAARTAFVLNQWKTVAENSRSLGWTSSSEESMMKLRREAATADAMKLILPTLMQRAAIDKALQETGSAPADTPDNIKTLGICAAISVGAGSACALYHKSPDQSYYRIDHLVANTAVEGQLETQRFVVQEIVKEAKEKGVPEVRLAAACYDDMKGTIYGSVQELGFEPPSEETEWAVYTE